MQREAIMNGSAAIVSLNGIVDHMEQQPTVAKGN
ncbi:hypothetical protein DFQ01_13360 [Paenibacillus cellulosilyticus]|uniref:Uncharacterized protein n=1 Tax=Paenibacillus cellulosilyticus TaxID=375489 RepID=A0A2V2YKU2_9BACL|nr:hypothetical protein DFQ01_13360 [Paenibacillus cellulosilyticus]